MKPRTEWKVNIFKIYFFFNFRQLQDIKPLAHIKMLKDKTNEYKNEIKTLREENYKISGELLGVNSQLERERAKNKLLEDENSELKSKLLDVTVDLQRLKKICENNPRMAVIEDPPIELHDSDDEEMESMEEYQNMEKLRKMEEIQNFQEIPRNTQKVFSCNVCPKTYFQEKRFHNHMLKHRISTSSVPITTQRGQNCTIKFTCSEPDCEFTCTYKPAFNRHVKAHKLSTKQCPHSGCFYKTPYEKRMKNHFDNKHRDSNLPDSSEIEIPQFTLQNDIGFMSMIHGGQVRL